MWYVLHCTQPVTRFRAWLLTPAHTGRRGEREHVDTAFSLLTSPTRCQTQVIYEPAAHAWGRVCAAIAAIARWAPDRHGRRRAATQLARGRRHCRCEALDHPLLDRRRSSQHPAIRIVHSHPDGWTDECAAPSRASSAPAILAPICAVPAPVPGYFVRLLTATARNCARCKPLGAHNVECGTPCSSICGWLLIRAAAAPLVGYRTGRSPPLVCVCPQAH